MEENITSPSPSVSSSPDTPGNCFLCLKYKPGKLRNFSFQDEILDKILGLWKINPIYFPRRKKKRKDGIACKMCLETLTSIQNVYQSLTSIQEEFNGLKNIFIDILKERPDYLEKEEFLLTEIKTENDSEDVLSAASIAISMTALEPIIKMGHGHGCDPGQLDNVHLHSDTEHDEISIIDPSSILNDNESIVDIDTEVDVKVKYEKVNESHGGNAQVKILNSQGQSEVKRSFRLRKQKSNVSENEEKKPELIQDDEMDFDGGDDDTEFDPDDCNEDPDFTFNKSPPKRKPKSTKGTPKPKKTKESIRKPEKHSSSSSSLLPKTEPTRKYRKLSKGKKTRRHFKCSFCPLFCKGQVLLEKHERQHVQAKKLNFKPCNIGEPSINPPNLNENELKDILRNQGIEGIFKCTICGANLFSRRSLRHHIETYHDKSELSYNCTHCNTPFYCEVSLYFHIKMHHPQVGNLADCDQCGKSFQTYSKLNQHKKRDHPEIIYNCEYCPKVFRLKFKQIAHMNNHLAITEEEERAKTDIKLAEEQNKRGGKEIILAKDAINRAYYDRKKSDKDKKDSNDKSDNDDEGADCDKKIKHDFNDQSHFPKSCPQCPKIFGLDEELEAHFNLRHSLVPCEVCGKMIIKGRIAEHISYVHGKATLKCNICGVLKKRKTELDMHMETHLENRDFLHTCEICGKSFLTKYGYTRHSKMHTAEEHPCPKCEKKFHSRHSCCDHIRKVHSVANLICTVCNKGKLFNREQLNKHMRTVHVEAKFKCHLCSYVTKTNFNLGIHMKTHFNKMQKGFAPSVIAHI